MISALAWAVLDAARDAGHLFDNFQAQYDPMRGDICIALIKDWGTPDAKVVYFRVPEITLQIRGLTAALEHIKTKWPTWFTRPAEGASKELEGG